VDCAYWTDRTAIAPYLKKGTQVYVEGNPDVRTYTTQDGRNGATLSLRVQTVQLLVSKNDDGTNSGGNYQSNPQPQAQSYNTPPNNFQPAQQAQDLVEPLDDLPF
jgi:single-strand DNA-binding protein